MPESSDPAIMEEVTAMQQIWQDQGGLVPKAALPEIFGAVSYTHLTLPTKA